jgi:hypothetical protein
LEKNSNDHDKEIGFFFDIIKNRIAQAIERTQRIGFKKEWQQ